MTRLCRTFKKITKQQGISTITMAVILLITVTVIIFFAASNTLMKQKVTANQNRSTQAFQAAEAGLDFGIVYLNQNKSTVIGSPNASGFINYSDSNTTNVTLANNSKFSVVYTNPTANNFNVILVTSTGVSDDNSSTKVVRQIVGYKSTLLNSPVGPLATQGAVDLGGSSSVINTTSNPITIKSGGTVGFSGNGQTLTNVSPSVVGSDKKAIGTDVIQNDPTLASQTANQFFNTYFGSTPQAVQSAATNFYENSSDTNYSSTLDGVTNAIVWINQTNGTTARIGSNATIGSASRPVILIVNGNLDVNGGGTFYGFIFVFGGVTFGNGNFDVYGSVSSTSGFSATGNFTDSYDTTTLGNLQNNFGSYAKIPGSWKDF